MSTDTILRLEEYTGLIENKIILVWTEQEPWLPTEFMLSQYITRILISGRNSPTSVSLTSDPGWTQIWRSPGSKEWSCLFGILPHMPGPILLVISTDITLSPQIMANLREVKTGLVVVMRSPTGGVQWNVEKDFVSHVFFPILGINTTMISIVQDWMHRPKSLDLKALIPQLASAGYGLIIANNIWQWYRPADSPPFMSLTQTQIGRQIQLLGSILEKGVALG